MNQYESQQIRAYLEQLGLCPAASCSKPDLVVVHTCCVTHTASSKSRQTIRQAQRENSDALIVVSGCLPIINIGELKIPTHNVHLIRDRSGLAAALNHLVCGHAVAPVSRSNQSCPNIPIKAQNSFKIKHKNENLDPRSSIFVGHRSSVVGRDSAYDLRHTTYEYRGLPPLTAFKEQTRAFLKIQDGCDGYCSYCIVPKTRPFVHSKPVEEVLLEAQALVNSGHKEIVLTGVFLGAYGQDTVRRKHWPNQRNDRLADLLDKVAQIPNLARIRLSSLEPGDVTNRLLDTFCSNLNIMPHLHLSLQSGSDRILKKMGRQYGIDEFRGVVESIKTRLDRPAITTDIIVGFPGETQADFQQTVDVSYEVGFTKMHVFSYSPRPGTPAEKSHKKADRNIIRKRSERLRQVGDELGRRYRQQFLGENAEILIENDAGDVSGRCERYFRVGCRISTDDRRHMTYDIRKNDLVKVKLIENHENEMIGIIMT